MLRCSQHDKGCTFIHKNLGVIYLCRHRTRKPQKNAYKQALTHFMMASWMQQQKPFQMLKYASGYLVILSGRETAAQCLPMSNGSRISLNRQLTAIRKQCDSTKTQIAH